MDTLLILKDSVAVIKATTCSHCVKEAGIRYQDVIIVLLICLTVIIVALVAINKYYKWKKYEKDASANAAKEKRKNDVEDRQWKLNIDKEAHELKREEDKEDHDKKLEEEQDALDKKRRMDLQDKLLCQLKDLAEIERDADGNEIIKYNDNSKEYITMLQTMISKLDSPTNTPNEQEA